ncbi:MAG: hypothetical protein ABI972_07950 [Acidobacteriota bacterium]
MSARFSDAVEEVFEIFRLLDGTRVAVKEAAACVVRLLEFAGHNLVHQAVAYKLATCEQF